MDFLRAALISPRQIVLGKVAAGAVGLTGPLLAPVFANGLICVGLLGLDIVYRFRFRHIGDAQMFFGLLSNFLVVFTGWGTLACCALLSLAVATLASLLARRTGTALLLGYAFSIVVYTGLPLLVWLIVSLTDVRGGYHHWDLGFLEYALAVAILAVLAASACLLLYRRNARRLRFGRGILWCAAAVQLFAALVWGLEMLVGEGIHWEREEDLIFFWSPLTSFWWYAIDSRSWGHRNVGYLYWAGTMVIFTAVAAGLLVLCVWVFKRFRMQDR